MQKLLTTLVVLAATVWAQSPPPPIPAAAPPSRQELKKAAKEFSEGVKSKDKGHINQAFAYFKQAAELAPQNPTYVTAREATRQLLVYDEIKKGNAALVAGKQVEAMGAFRSALNLDPENTFVKQRLLDAMPPLPRVLHDDSDSFQAAAAVQLQPEPGLRTFKFRGNNREILQQVAQAYGLTPVIDESVINRNVRFEVGDVDWATAADLLAKICKVFWTPLSAKQVMFIADNDQNRRALQRMSLRTFYVPDATSTQDLNEIANTLRVLFDIRYLTIQPTSNTIVIRAVQPVVDAVTSFLDGLSIARPQVMLDIQAIEINRNATSDIGVHVPTSFTAFNVPTETQKLLGNQSIQNIINQLISSGAINQANSSAIAAIIAQALNGQSSIFNQPLLIFGGGVTLTALTLPGTSIHLSVDKSNMQTLEHMTVRASHGSPVDFRIGTRYPIINATFAPIFGSQSINQVIANQTFRAPIPSVNYEDLGIVLKTSPLIRHDDVSLDFQLGIRALGATSFNGIPVINNREYKGNISTGDGQAIVIAGLITQTEQNNLTGIPLMSQLPGIGYAFGTKAKTNNIGELLIIITPHIVRERAQAPQEIRLPVTAPR